MSLSQKKDVEPDVQAQSILIVDDNPANLGLIADYLETYGLHVLVAQDGEDGLKKAQLAQPSLILLDVMLPGINGFETCRRLKADDRTKDIPVMIMTVLTDTEHKLKGFQVGAVDYITKPFQKEEVLARVTTHLTLRKLQKELQENNETLEQRVAERTEEIEALKNRLQAENVYLQEEIKRQHNFEEIIIPGLPQTRCGASGGPSSQYLRALLFS